MLAQCQELACNMHAEKQPIASVNSWLLSGALTNRVRIRKLQIAIRGGKYPLWNLALCQLGIRWFW